MMLTLEGREPCLLCGCQLRSWIYPTAVINKRSIRLKRDHDHLSAADWKCPECGTPAIQLMRAVYRLTASCAAEVAAYRARRWGTP